MRLDRAFFLYFIGLLLGIICVNLGFDITELSYGSQQSWSFYHFFLLLLKRGTEASLLIFLLRVLPKKWARVCLLSLTGMLVGGLASIRACTGTAVLTFLYGGVVFLLATCYMSAVGLAMDAWGSDSIYVKKPALVAWMRRVGIVTILLLTCAAELNILKFF